MNEQASNLNGEAPRTQQVVERGRTTAASGLHRAASTVRSRAEQQGGRMAQLGGAVAERVDRAAGYVEEHDAAEILGDARSYPDRHPFQMLVGTAVAGFLVGRTIAPGKKHEKSWQERMNEWRRESALLAASAFEQGRETATAAFEQGRQAATVAFEQGRSTAADAVDQGRERWKKSRRGRAPLWKRAVRLGR